MDLLLEKDMVTEFVILKRGPNIPMAGALLSLSRPRGGVGGGGSGLLELAQTLKIRTFKPFKL